jgi:hypothetical protein
MRWGANLKGQPFDVPIPRIPVEDLETRERERDVQVLFPQTLQPNTRRQSCYSRCQEIQML